MIKCDKLVVCDAFFLRGTVFRLGRGAFFGPCLSVLPMRERKARGLPAAAPQGHPCSARPLRPRAGRPIIGTGISSLED